MKPLPVSKDVSVFVPAVRLYRDDLERILAHMNEAHLRTTISDETFEYDSLDELKKARGSFARNVNIAGVNGDLTRYRKVTLSTWHNQWHLYSFGDVYDIARDVEGILRARQSLVERVPYLWMIFIGLAMITGSEVGRFISTSAVYAILGVGVGLSVTGGMLLLYSKLRNGITLSYRHEAGFFARNRDKILLLLIGAAAAGLFTFILWYFTGKPV